MNALHPIRLITAMIAAVASVLLALDVLTNYRLRFGAAEVV